MLIGDGGKAVLAIPFEPTGLKDKTVAARVVLYQPEV